MTIKRATLGACFMLACSAFAGHTYTVLHSGSTVTDVSNKLGVPEKAIIRANDLGGRRKLHKGEVLVIPSSKTSAKDEVSVQKSAGSYVIRNGDSDWTVAHRYHLTVPQLAKLNPGVNLRILTIGHKLHVPGHSIVASKSADKAPSAHGAAHVGTYIVKQDDNDWIIAKNVGISTHVLHQLNPGLHWNAIHPGQKVRVPGSGVVASGVPVIHTRHAYIAKDAVVLRRGPSIDSEKIVTVDKGIKVTVIDRDGKWYKLHFPKGTEAWVRGDNLKPAEVAVATVEHRGKPVRVARNENRNSRRTRIHSARLAYLERLERLHRSQIHSKDSATRRLARLTARRVKAAQYAASLPVSDTDLIADAKKWIGTPYRYGSMSRGATDCSGYVGQVYRSHGVRLPRTSVEQSHVGKTVSKGDLSEGDLVFFRTRGSGRVSHVGMYIGNGKFIHASSGGGQVQIGSLGDSYYSKRFAGAKRVAKLSSHHKAAKHVAKVEDVRPKDEDGDN